MNLPVSMRWWAFVVRGVLAIIFGLIALFQPGIALASLILVFGAYAFADGVFALVAALSGPGQQRLWLILTGILGIVAGIIAFVNPSLTALSLLLLIGFWAIFIGISEIIAAWRYREVIQNEFWLALSGILAVLFGVYVTVSPGGGALAIVWTIGWFAILAGVMLVILGFRLRMLKESIAGTAEGMLRT
jgi:uncharacterized membrane protein HdeD (DUF308 family)